MRWLPAGERLKRWWVSMTLAAQRGFVAVAICGGVCAVCAVVLKTLISATCGTTLNTQVPASRVEKGKTRG